MIAKPGRALSESIRDHEAHTQLGQEELDSLIAKRGLFNGVAEGLARMTARLARAAGARVLSQAELLSRILAVPDGSALVDGQPRELLERSLRVAEGEEAPESAWALGQAWRDLYPAIAQAAESASCQEPQWQPFRRLVAELERLAYGPPPVNARVLLELIDSGFVDLRFVAGGQIAMRGAREFEIRGGAEAVSIDGLIDAVLPGPGAHPGCNRLFSGLIATSHVRLIPGGRGLDVDADATCISAEGERSEGLAAIGRPTEDSVFDNDTLSRLRHPQPDRWARRVVARAATPGARVATPA